MIPKDIFEHDFENFPELTNAQLERLQFISPHEQITEDFEATVTKVSDGDTIRVTTNFRDFDFPIRLFGIDAPEMNAGGEQARDYVMDRVLEKKVSIQINVNNRVDKYGRLLGYVFQAGMSIGEEELRLGLVTTFKNRREDKITNLDKMFSIKQWLS